MQVWAGCCPGLDDRAVAAAALRRGIDLLPLSTQYHHGPPRAWPAAGLSPASPSARRWPASRHCRRPSSTWRASREAVPPRIPGNGPSVGSKGFVGSARRHQSETRSGNRAMYIAGEEEIDAIARVHPLRRAVPLWRRQRVRALREALCRVPRASAISRWPPAAPIGLAAGADRRSASAPATRCWCRRTPTWRRRPRCWRSAPSRSSSTSTRASPSIPQAVARRDRAAHAGGHPGAHVGRGLQHGRDHGDRRAARPDRARGRLPGHRRRLRGPQARLDRPCRRLQLQLLQEHDLRRGRRRRHQPTRRSPSAPAAPSTPATSTGRAATTSLKPFAGDRRARLGADGRDAERPARPARRHDRAPCARRRRRILAGTSHLGNLGLRPSPMNSPDHDCATQVMFLLPTAEAAQRLRADYAERDRRQDRAAHLHRNGTRC